jgi:hypothetical protein
MKAELDRQHELDKIAAQKVADETKLELENRIKQLEQGMKDKDAALQRNFEEADERKKMLQGVCKSLVLLCMRFQDLFCFNCEANSTLSTSCLVYSMFCFYRKT